MWPKQSYISTEKVLNESASGDTPLAVDPKDSDGNSLASPVAGYVLSDKDDDASPNYYGYVDKEGNYYIMKETISPGADTYRFVKDSSGYTTAWTGRVGLSYDYFYNTF